MAVRRGDIDIATPTFPNPLPSPSLLLALLACSATDGDRVGLGLPHLAPRFEYVGAHIAEGDRNLEPGQPNGPIPAVPGAGYGRPDPARPSLPSHPGRRLQSGPLTWASARSAQKVAPSSRKRATAAARC